MGECPRGLHTPFTLNELGYTYTPLPHYSNGQLVNEERRKD